MVTFGRTNLLLGLLLDFWVRHHGLEERHAGHFALRKVSKNMADGGSEDYGIGSSLN